MLIYHILQKRYSYDDSIDKDNKKLILISSRIFKTNYKDGKVSASDYVTIKNHIMDVKKIVQ